MSFSRKQASREGLRLTGEVRGPVLEPQATLAPSLLTTEVTGTGIMEETTTTTRGKSGGGQAKKAKHDPDSEDESPPPSKDKRKSSGARTIPRKASVLPHSLRHGLPSSQLLQCSWLQQWG